MPSDYALRSDSPTRNNYFFLSHQALTAWTLHYFDLLGAVTSAVLLVVSPKAELPPKALLPIGLLQGELILTL